MILAPGCDMQVADHLKSGRWDYSFWAGDHMTPDGVPFARAWLLRTFFVPENALFFRPESVMQELLLPQLRDIPTITNDELTKQVVYNLRFPATKATSRSGDDSMLVASPCLRSGRRVGPGGRAVLDRPGPRLSGGRRLPSAAQTVGDR